MKKHIFKVVLACLLSLGSTTLAQETLFYHDINVDSQGHITPWYSQDPGTSYDHVIGLVWNFWNNMRTDVNGLPYYMNHQVWTPDVNDSRGLGGDQFQMAMSSWQLLYAYTGNELVKQNMKFIADYYLSHSLSPEKSKWPNLPYPYNTLIYSGIYDGDMVIGQGFLQPDKAGSLGLELMHLYKMVKNDSSIQSIPDRYLKAAVKIGQTLVKHVWKGNATTSPLPFKVNAVTGEIGDLRNNNGDGTIVGAAGYTTNWAPTMELFLILGDYDLNNRVHYKNAFNVLLKWMNDYPLKNNNWGPFFEDVQGWSDTQINAVTFARFMLEHREFFPDWKTQVPGIFDWVYKTLGNNNWSAYGVTVVNEQTSFPVPGQSHMARQGATELLYCSLSGDNAVKDEAIRRLTWATYSVDFDGKNRFPFDGNWLTDGYGDYVKHYIRAMAALPELAPPADHILSSTSVVQQANYGDQDKILFKPFPPLPGFEKARLAYRTFDAQGVEVIRLAQKPSGVLLGNVPLNEVSDENAVGYLWTPLNTGGFLKVTRDQGTDVTVLE